MKKMLTCLIVAAISIPAFAGDHSSVEAEIREVAEAFNTSYATNDVETGVWQKIDGKWRLVNMHYSEIPTE